MKRRERASLLMEDDQYRINLLHPMGSGVVLMDLVVKHLPWWDRLKFTTMHSHFVHYRREAWRKRAAGKLVTFNKTGDMLNVIPNAFWDMQHLQCLYLDGNNLSIISPEIGKFRDLQTLDLSANCLVELPEEITQLAKLTRLSLNHNQLRKLPSKLFEMTALRDLSVNFNPLEAMPRLPPNLDYLYITATCITVLKTAPRRPRSQLIINSLGAPPDVYNNRTRYPWIRWK